MRCEYSPASQRHKKWGFFILHVSRIKVFLEIHIDFQKCTKHHIFVPFQNNPYVSFWLQKVNISLENKLTSGSLYMCTLAYTNMNFFHMTLATPGSFLRTTILEADITCTLREFLFYESQPRFFFPCAADEPCGHSHPRKPGLFCLHMQEVCA